jgi:hypothetical protein
MTPPPCAPESEGVCPMADLPEVAEKGYEGLVLTRH